VYQLIHRHLLLQFRGLQSVGWICRAVNENLFIVFIFVHICYSTPWHLYLSDIQAVNVEYGSGVNVCWLPAETTNKLIYSHKVVNVIGNNLPSKTALRSSHSGDFVVPSTRLRLEERAFSVAASCACNYLLAELKATHVTQTFKRNLKMFLYDFNLQ